MEKIEFYLADSKGRKITKPFIHELIFHDKYINIIKSFICDDVDEESDRIDSDVFLQYDTTIFKDSIDSIGIETAYLYPALDFDDVIWQVSICYKSVSSYLSFKTEKEAIEAKQKILDWKLGK